jgi:hypothetical protein
MKIGHKIMSFSLLCCWLVIVSGCISQKEAMVNQGYPLPYADGVDDGCHSGKKAGGSMFDQFKKDVSRFEVDSQYAQGWSDGFRQCETEQESMQRQIRMNIEQQRLIEDRKHNEWKEQRHLEREVLRGIDTSGLENFK